jgi:hypothetical protein
MVAIVSKPGKPITLSSSHGASVALTMPGAGPKVLNTDRKSANVKFGGATVSLGCDEGRLIVHDFSTDKDYLLHELLKAFLTACRSIIKDRMPRPDDETRTTPPLVVENTNLQADSGTSS